MPVAFDHIDKAITIDRRHGATQVVPLGPARTFTQPVLEHGRVIYEADLP